MSEVRTKYKIKEGTAYADSFKNLVFDILQSAIEDYLLEGTYSEMPRCKDIRREIDRKTSKYFFKSKWYEFLCGSLGMSGDYILRQLDKKLKEGEDPI